MDWQSDVVTRSIVYMSEMEYWLKQNEIEFVECLVPDFNGIGKGKIVPAEQLVNGEIRLPEAIFGQDILGQWCHEYDLVDIADVDMILIPDESTLAVQPWSTKTAQCICDCQSRDGSELNIAPRSLLKKIIKLFTERRMSPIIAQEAEFYLIAKNPDPNLPVSAAQGVSGRQQNAPRSFQTEALSEYSPFLTTLKNFTRQQNVTTAGFVQEMGRGQIEINFSHGDALARADEMFNFKRIARQAALENGYHATFLSKPITREPGSAMHLHQSLVDTTSGRNLFINEDASFSETFYAYLGGLQKYTKSGMAFFAPHVNSYRRFEVDKSCPINVEWGLDNRTTGFRVPVAKAKATRIENRIPGSDTNPYLAIATNLACGYLGLEEGLSASDPIKDSAWDLPNTMPLTLNEALTQLADCNPLNLLLGDRFMRLYIDIKQREARAFSEEVTAWEREHLLLTV